MVATIDEHTQWFDETTNTPIVNGFLYIGARNGDPRVAISIFSDRELTTPLANPQRTDAAGRSINKIWIPGRYSIEVSNSNDVQKYIEIDVGESSSASVINLGNVQGANAITATGAPTITSYDDLSQFVFRTIQVNTDAVTLNVDGVGARSIVKNQDKPIQPGDFEADQNVIVTYNLTEDVLEWTNQNIKSVSSYKGSDIADSAAPSVPTDGNYFEALGTTTRTSYVVKAGISWKEKTLGARTYTASASIVTESGSDIVVTANSVISFQSVADNIVQVTKGPVTAATKSEQEAGTSISVFVTPENQQFHPSALSAWSSFNQTGTQALGEGFNFSSITDLAIGRSSFGLTNNMNATGFGIDTNGEFTNASLSLLGVYEPTSPTVSVIVLQCSTQTTAQKDITFGFIGLSGDLA